MQRCTVHFCVDMMLLCTIVRRMALIDEIAVIESRLAASRIPLGRLFREAEVDRSTWSRWRSGATGPRLSKWLAVKAAVERLLGSGEGAAA